MSYMYNHIFGLSQGLKSSCLHFFFKLIQTSIDLKMTIDLHKTNGNFCIRYSDTYMIYTDLKTEHIWCMFEEARTCNKIMMVYNGWLYDQVEQLTLPLHKTMLSEV